VNSTSSVAQHPGHLSPRIGGEWDVGITFTATGRDRLHADAVLSAGLDHIAGHGDTRKHPNDPNIPEVAAQVAASRALVDLASQLQRLADAQLQAWDDAEVLVLPPPVE
jgi:hypothetical protein